MTAKWRSSLAGVAMLVAVVLSGCTSAVTGPESSSPLPTEPSSGGEAPLGAAAIEWDSCTAEQVTPSLASPPADLQNYQCATVAVPLNWDKPSSSETIDLSVARYIKAGKDAKPLFFNLGGPGADAVNSLSTYVGQLLPTPISDAYQIVAIDPRGVGASSPLHCRDDEELDRQLSGIDEEKPEEPAARAELYRTRMAEFAAACEEKSGELVKFVDTNSVARDFDHLRGLLGAEEFDYIGYSYGTALGAEYAATFPNRVGRMVLDGALDPAVSANDLSALQARGMELALYNWIDWCLAQSSCPVGPDAETAKQQFIDLLDQTDEEPLPTSDPDRPLTASLARTGIVGSLYSSASYDLLRQGMNSALAGNGRILLLLADYYNGRESDGTYSNSQDAFTVVNALENEPVGTLEEWAATSEELAANYPVIGRDFGFASASLQGWPFDARSTRGSLEVSGTAPIVIIGTTNDPATAYVMAESLSASIEDSALITVEGWDHGAYKQGASECLLDLVNPYLLDGDVPRETTCP